MEIPETVPSSIDQAIEVAFQRTTGQFIEIDAQVGTAKNPGKKAHNARVHTERRPR